MPVYAMRCGDYVKVGTTDHATARRRLRQVQAMCPYPLELVGVATEGHDTAPLTLESWHQQHLMPYHYRGEWFHLCPTVELYLKVWFTPCHEVAPEPPPPPRRLGPSKTRLADNARGRLT